MVSIELHSYITAYLSTHEILENSLYPGVVLSVLGYIAYLYHIIYEHMLQELLQHDRNSIL